MEVPLNANLKHSIMRNTLLKPVILLVLIAAMFVICSCEKDKNINEADLIGTWEMGQASVDIKVGPISLIQFLKTTLQLTDQQAQDLFDQLASEFDEFGGTITFETDYSYHLLNGDFGENGTWELDEDQLYLILAGESTDDDPLTLESLNSAAALVVWEEDQEVDIDEDGTGDFTATLIVELNLSKQ